MTLLHRNLVQTNLEGTGEGIHEQRKEQEGATLEETLRVRLQVVEDTSDNEAHDDVSNERTNGDTRVTD